MILIDATPLQSEHRHRGVGTYLRNLIMHIEADGSVEPTYLATWHDRNEVRELLPSERTVVLPRLHRPAQVYWIYNEFYLRAALAMVRPHVFFAPDFNGLVRNPFGRTVATLYDLTALKLQLAGIRALGLSEKLSAVRWRAYQRKLRDIDHVMAISQNAKADATNLLHLPPTKITVAHLGVDHDRFVSAAGQGAFANEAPYLLNVGSRGENKNQHRILEAFARIAREHPDVQLCFAGPWHENDLAWLDMAAERHGLSGVVSHVGYVRDDDLPSLYGNATAFMFPSLEEGFGLPVLEAMASGTPVVTSDRGALREVAGDAAMLVNPSSPDAIAEAMRQLLSSPDLRRDLIDRGVARATRFSWQRTAKSTIEVLQSLEGSRH